jgi:hypothetical protein
MVASSMYSRSRLMAMEVAAATAAATAAARAAATAAGRAAVREAASATCLALLMALRMTVLMMLRLHGMRLDIVVVAVMEVASRLAVVAAVARAVGY